MALSFNPHTRDFILVTSNKKRAEEAGLTLSTVKRSIAGEPMYFTKEHYAVLEFYQEADNSARAELDKMKYDFEKSWANESPNIHAVGPHAPGPLRPFQNAGVDYALPRTGVLIGDEPGLGKTAQAVATNNESDAGHNLVICPARIRRQWRDAIRDWSTIPNVRTYLVERSSDGIATWPHYTVMSYELTRNPHIHEAICSQQWDSVTIDEAHFLKSYDAKRTKAIFGQRNPEDSIAAKAKRVMCLTGTPLPNRPRECYTMARALQWDSIDWLEYEAFKYRFNPSQRVQKNLINPITGEEMLRWVNEEDRGRLPELQARLRSNFMVRRLKADVLKDLPDKQYEFAYIEEDGRIADIVRRERMLDFDVNDLKQPWSAELWGEISTLRREMGEAKVPQAVEHVKFLIDIVGLEKIVIFSHHRNVMDMMRKALESYGVVEVRGGMSPTQSERACMEFRTNPRVKIFSGQLDAAGFGVDHLQDVAFHVLFVEPAWTPGTNEQAVDRLHRLGQHANVIAQFLVVEGSMDERMLATIIDKTHTIDAALDGRKRKII